MSKDLVMLHSLIRSYKLPDARQLMQNSLPAGGAWASELILEWGRRAESGGWGFGEGTASPSSPTRAFAGTL